MSTVHIESSVLGSWVKTNPVAVATLLGGGIYVLAFESYRAALRPFNVTPSDVGITYTDVIWPVVNGVLFGTLVICGVLTFTAQTLSTRRWQRLSTVWFAAAVLFVLLAVLAIGEENRYQKTVFGGRSYRPPLASRLQVLAALRAECVRIRWSDATQTKPPLPAGDVLYLGASSGTSVFYSARLAQTLRIPSGSIVVVHCSSSPPPRLRR